MVSLIEYGIQRLPRVFADRCLGSMSGLDLEVLHNLVDIEPERERRIASE